MDGSPPTIIQISEFFVHLFLQRKIAPSTIRGYRTALADYYPAALDIRHSEVLARLLNSFYRDQPPSARCLPPWDLGVVLASLRESPFEPLEKVSITDLTRKTVFLVALGTARRRSELSALARSRVKFSTIDHSVTVAPGVNFLAKNQSNRGTQADRMKDIVIPSLEALVGHDLPQDALNCPVRALRIYMKRTDPYRGDRDRFFLPIRPGQVGEI